MAALIRLLLICTLAVLMAQCGDLRDPDRDQDESEPPEEIPSDQPPEYRYRFRNLVNGIPCDTGEHVLPDKLEYCRALTDNRLNRGCALTAREDEFNEQCQDVAFEWPR